MNISASSVTLSQLLTTLETGESARSARYQIPAYQRAYQWESKNCEALVTDLGENSAGYFVGTMLLVPAKVTAKQVVYDIIDGQQRLTTLCLLAVALSEQTAVTPAHRAQLRDLLVDQTEHKLTLQAQNQNQEDFRQLIDYRILGIGSGVGDERRRLQRNLAFLETLVAELPDPDALAEKLLALTLVPIIVDRTADAYRLFAAMNSKGVPLSPVDLIKNTYVAQGGSAAAWDKMLGYLGDDCADHEQFFRNHYNAFAHYYNGWNTVDLLTDDKSRKTKAGLKPRATRSSLVDIYESLLRDPAVGAENLVNHLTDCAKVYAPMLGNVGGQEYAPEILAILTNFRRAEATSAYLLVLYLLASRGQLGLQKDQDLAAVLQYLLTFFVRRNLTNLPGTGNVPQILMEIIRKLAALTLPAPTTFNQVQNVIQTVLAPYSKQQEKLVKDRLQGDIYDDNAGLTRYLLCRLCEQEWVKEKATKKEFSAPDLWQLGANQKRYAWTIEHILPQGNADATNLQPAWLKMVGGADPKETVKKYRHRLGNLTLSAYNSEMRDKPLPDKQRNYNPDLPLNRADFAGYDLPTVATWTAKEITERTRILADKVATMLQL